MNHSNKLYFIQKNQEVKLILLLIHKFGTILFIPCICLDLVTFEIPDPPMSNDTLNAGNSETEAALAVRDDQKRFRQEYCKPVQFRSVSDIIGENRLCAFKD